MYYNPTYSNDDLYNDKIKYLEDENYRLSKDYNKLNYNYNRLLNNYNNTFKLKKHYKKKLDSLITYIKQLQYSVNNTYPLSIISQNNKQNNINPICIIKKENIDNDMNETEENIKDKIIKEKEKIIRLNDDIIKEKDEQINKLEKYLELIQKNINSIYY